MYKKTSGNKSNGASPEDRDECIAERVFWVPREARWSYPRAMQANLIDPINILYSRDIV